MDLLRSLPIGLYLEQPVTWLHRIDSRVKLGWLLSILLSPIAANPAWRVGIVIGLILLTFSTRLPFRVWKKQMGLVLLFSLLLFGITLFAPDGVNVSTQPRLPNPAQELAWGTAPTSVSSAAPETATTSSPDSTLLELPQPTAYQYVLLQREVPILRSIRITRRSVELAIRTSTLMFILLYSTNLYLLTTAPEEVTAGVDSLFQPLRRFQVPVTEIVLTLTLSLRFIPLVLEEVQNLVRSVRTRAINWKKLGFRGSMQVWVMVAERLIDNLLTRAEQIASAMQVRGFTSPNHHHVQWHQFRLTAIDWLVMAGIGGFWAARLILGQ